MKLMQPIIMWLTLMKALMVGAADMPADWKPIDNKSFSFYLPAGFKKNEVRGIDSAVESYESRDISLLFDYGAWSNNFQDWPASTKFNSLKINGRKVRIGTMEKGADERYPYATQVHFPEAVPGKSRMKLSVLASCASEKDVELAHAIFKTIKFLGK